jgi:hypothetical protein
MRKVATVISVLDAADEANLETVKEGEAEEDYEEHSSDEDAGTQQRLGVSALERKPSAESFNEDTTSPISPTNPTEVTWGSKDAYKQINAPNSRWGSTVRLISQTNQNVAEVSYPHWKYNKAAVMNFQRWSEGGTRTDIEMNRVKKTSRAHSLTTPDGKTYTWAYDGKWKRRNIVMTLKQGGEDVEVARVSLNGSVWGTILAHGDRKLTINRDLVPEEVALTTANVMLRHERDRRRAYWASASHGGGGGGP